MTKPVDEFLMHYGVVGMKWGKRTGGLKSRISGAAADRNQRNLAYATRAATGKQTKGERLLDKSLIGHLMGKKNYQKIMSKRVSYLQGQKKRIESGKTSLLDKIETVGDTYVSTVDLFVSRRDNKG